MKKNLFVLLIIMSIFFVFMTVAHSAEIVDSGNCGADGDNLTWTLDDKGTLIISGEGAMADWDWNTPFFNNDNIKNVIIENGATSVGNRAFNWCQSLTSISIPTSVTSIGDNAFFYCLNLTDINIPTNATHIGDGAFYQCSSLTNIVIPTSVTNIGNNVFEHCENLTNIVIPTSVTSIGEAAFAVCSKLTSITIPDGVPSIADFAFTGCSSLTNIAIPNSVMSIGDNAFYKCSSLKDISIPVRMESIGNSAFYQCNNLTDVYYNGNKAEWNSISIDDWNSALTNAQIHCMAEPSFTISQYEDRVEIINTDSVEREATVIIAEYENDVLRDVRNSIVRFDEGQEITYPLSASLCKVFVWNSLSGMRPLNYTNSDK